MRSSTLFGGLSCARAMMRSLGAASLDCRRIPPRRAHRYPRRIRQLIETRAFDRFAFWWTDQRRSVQTGLEPDRRNRSLLAGRARTRPRESAWRISRCAQRRRELATGRLHLLCFRHLLPSVSFYEMLPQDDGTVVWQIDFASAPFRSFTGGLDRVFAGNEMAKESVLIAKLFRADVEKNQ